jgi:hypothetical protein
MMPANIDENAAMNTINQISGLINQYDLTIPASSRTLINDPKRTKGTTAKKKFLSIFIRILTKNLWSKKTAATRTSP